VQRDLRRVCDSHGLKGTEPNVQGDRADYDAHCANPIENLRRKVQSRGGRGRRATLPRVDRLVSLAVERRVIAMNVRGQWHVSECIQSLIEISYRGKAQRPLSTLAGRDDVGVKSRILRTRKLDSIAHPKLTTRLHKGAPLPGVDLFCQQDFHATGCGLFFIQTKSSRPKQTRRNDPRIIQHQHVSCPKLLWEMREAIVSPCAGCALDQKHARSAAVCWRLLRNQFLGQDKVEVRDEHSPILLPWRRIAREVALGQATKALKRRFNGKSRLLFCRS
jgi:hypothetical protein